jgi:hypothetical protein
VESIIPRFNGRLIGQMIPERGHLVQFFTIEEKYSHLPRKDTAGKATYFTIKRHKGCYCESMPLAKSIKSLIFSN